MIKLLYAVLGIYILIKFYSPVVDEIKNIKKQIFLIDQNIEKNRFFLKESDKINLMYKKTLEIDKTNQKYFFPHDKTSSQIFTELQMIIKSSLNRHSIETRYVKWLDIQKNRYFKKHPIKIYIKTTPEKFALFINEICQNQKLINIENIKINAINPRKKIIYEIIFTGYQLKGDK